MNINTKTRAELKNFFKKNAIPTEGNFADFIDAGVNQKDDGLLKPAGEPLSLEASLNAKTAIRFYETFAGNTNPSWVVSLADPGTHQPAFVLSDALGNTRLSIGQNGAVTAPGAVTVGSLTTAGAITAASITTTGGASTGALSVASLTATTTIIAGGLISANAGLSVPAGQNLTVGGALTVSGTTTASNINASGPVNAGGLISANGGITVPPGKILTVGGTLSAGITTATSLTVNGSVSITGGGALAAGTINASGLTAGTLTVAGTTTTNTLNANDIINANAGLTIPSGQTLTVNGTLNAKGPALTASGLISANGGLTVPMSATLSVAGSFSAYNPIYLAASTRTGIRLDKAATQFLTLPSIPATIDFASGMMIQAWIYLYSLDEFAKITDFVGVPPTGADDLGFNIHADGSIAIRITKGTALSALVSPPGVLTTGVWTHVAATVDNSGNAKLYRNLAQVASGTVLIPNNVVRGQSYIGKSWQADPYLNAILSDVSVWTGIRTPTTASLNGNEPGLIGYWKLYILAQQGVDFCFNTGHLGNATLVSGETWGPGAQAGILQDDWTSAALNTGWTGASTDYNPPGYFRDSLGIVHLRGLLHFTTFGNTAFNLPAGYRPRFNERFVCSTSVNTCGIIDVGSQGNVNPNTAGSASWFTLDGITFRAYQ